MFSSPTPVRSGPRCPECNEALDWPARDLPDDHILKCPNGHALCSMGDFRLAAREMAMQEEFRLTRGTARSHAPQQERKDADADRCAASAAERIELDRPGPERKSLDRQGLAHAELPHRSTSGRISAA